MGWASGTGIGPTRATSGTRCFGTEPGMVFGRREIMMAPSVLLRQQGPPLFASRCSRWHRVPRPRRVDGVTRDAIDAMPHAGMDYTHFLMGFSRVDDLAEAMCGAATGERS